MHFRGILANFSWFYWLLSFITW